MLLFFFFKQKTAYEMRISDWSSDVCSSDLTVRPGRDADILAREQRRDLVGFVGVVKGADPETELARNVDHHRHFIGAIAVILDENLALQHPCKRFELQIALRGIPVPAVILPLVTLARIVGGVDPRLALARDVTTPRRLCAALAPKRIGQASCRERGGQNFESLV